MASCVCGPVAYELITGYNQSLTDEQVDALINEYAKLGIRYQKSVWNENPCIIVRAPAKQYECFKEKLLGCWQGIKHRVGHGLLESRSNTFEPGRSNFVPSKDWHDVVEFIETNYRQDSQQKEQAQDNDTMQDREILGLVSDYEISVLISIAQDANAGYAARGKAIQKLGEVGGSSAIEPLMQIYNTELHLIRLDAKDAADKIKLRSK